MNWKAVLLGLLSYPILWVIWLFLSPEYAHKGVHWFTIASNLFYLLMPVISGFLAAHIARTRGFYHGALVGVLIALLSTGVWAAIDILDMQMLSPLAGIVLLSALGGALSQGYRAFVAKRG